MTILCSQLRQLSTETHVERIYKVFLLYPKLVIFETPQHFSLINLANNKDTEGKITYFNLGHDVSDILLKDQLLWIILKSGELLVVHVIKDLQLKLCINNYTNYKINRFLMIENKLILISESGETLTVPHSASEVVQWFDQDLKEIEISLEKVRINKKDLLCKKNADYKMLYGLQVSVESGDISVQCPYTGLTETIFSPAEVTDVIPWNDMVIINKTTKMSLMNLTTSTELYEFKENSYNYYPVGTYNSMLYYLQWSKDMITINCASDATTNTSFQNYKSCPKKKEVPQETLKAEVESISSAALSNADCGQVLSQLKSLFDKIDDVGFLVNISSRLCQHNATYKPLLYFLQKHHNSTQNIELLDLLTDLLIKVELLEYITFKGSNSSYEKYDLFEQNYVQLCQLFVSKSDIDLASICWLKYSGMNIKLSNNDVLNILNAIPNNIKLTTLIIWLRSFVPPLLDENPYFIDIFAKWTSERVFLLEQSGYWPKIGLKFIDEIVNVLQSSMNSVCLRPISMDDLDTLKDHITYIMELKEKYKINMLLNEITSQSPSEVTLIMLHRCYTEDLNAFLQNFLQNFALRYLLEVDDILSSYIETETVACGGGIEGLRLKILLEAFQIPTKKLECLLQVLKVLDVPWDNSVSDLAVTTAGNIFKDFTVSESDRNLAQEIQKEINYAQVKVVLKKYNYPLSCTDYTLVLHKLINAPTVDLNDFKIITKVMGAHTSFGNILYIDRCLRDCETNTALDFFNSLSNRDKKILLKTVLMKYEQQLNSSTNNVTERNYLDFLKGTKLLSNIEINNIENLYYLKNSYNLKLCLNSINNEKICQDIANQWASRDEVAASSGRGRCVSQLTGSLNTRDSILITLLCRTSTSNKVRKIVESLILLLPFDGNTLKLDLKSVLSELERNTELLIDSFNVLTELILLCPEEYIHYLVRCLSILNGFLNTNVVVKNLTMIWKFHYVFLSMSSTNANDLIEIYAKTFSRNYCFGDMVASSKSALSIFRNICNIQEHVVSSDFDKSNVRSEHTNNFVELKHKAAHKLLSKVIAAQNLDEVLLTSLLLILNGDKKSEDSMWILDILQGQADSLPIPLTYYLSLPAIRRTFSLDTILPGTNVTYPPQYILKSKFNINLADMVLSDGTEETWDVKVILFCVLRQFRNTDFNRLVELCYTLNVSINDGLSLQLIALLTTWEVEYKVVSDELSSRHVYVKNNENSLATKSLLIWDSITDKTFIRDILSDFWKNGEVTLHGRLVSVNPYYYEVYICIYQLIYGTLNESKHKKAYFLLNFLKEYKRKSAPKQFEFELFSVKGMFPEIGYYRLPFHLFTREDMWSNLKSEITLETYELWLPAVDLLSLDADLQTAKDMICSNAVKQTMTSRKHCDTTDEESKENESWCLIMREEPLLRAAHRCVKHISNMEWAGACLFYVLQGCTRGADQVAAAQLCYQFAQRWAALQPGNRAVRQMERLHSTLSTRHALHKIEWARDEFVRLSTEPAQLIRALYLHPEFIGKMSRYDVNRAANEIADKNGINISSIRIQILDSILTKNHESNKNEFHGLDVKKLITAKYILRATCPKMGAIYLSRIAFDEESDYDKSKKFRALQCLMSVVDSDTAIKVTSKARDALWSSLLDLLFIVNLESIDLPWIVATFVQDKVKALEQLIQTSGNNVEYVRIAAQLARRFGDVTMIRNLLPLLLRSTLYDETKNLLLKISCLPDDIIYTAWRTIILAPFQQADYPITERQKAKCLNAINLLPICPVIKDDDLIEIWKNSLRCKCIGLGCLILPYISPKRRQTLAEIQRIDRRNLIASLKNLQTETYLVPGAMHVVESMTSRSYS